MPRNTTWSACSPLRSIGRPLAPRVNGGVATSRVPVAGPFGSSDRSPKLNRTTSRLGRPRISTFVIRSEGRRPVWRSTAHAAAKAAGEAEVEVEATGVAVADGVGLETVDGPGVGLG